MKRVTPYGFLMALALAGCAAETPPGQPANAQRKPSAGATPAPDAAPTPPPPPPAEFVSTNVTTARSPSDFRDSIERNLKKVQEDPRDFDAYMQLGSAYRQLKQLKAAERAYENASLVDPTRKEPMLELALVAMDAGMPAKAVDLYQELLRRDPHNRSIENDLATAYRKKRDLTNAFRLIRELLNEDKTNVFAINNLGLIYLETGRNELAELTFQKGKKINASQAETYNNLGLTYLAMGISKNAVTEFKKAAELNSKLVEPRLNLGDLYLKHGNYTQAAATYEEVLRIDPLNLQANLNAGSCYMALKKGDAAKGAFTTVAEMDPSNKDALFNLGLLYQGELQDAEQALKYFKKYVSVSRGELKPNDQVFTYIQQLEQMKKRQEKAAAEKAAAERAAAEKTAAELRGGSALPASAKPVPTKPAPAKGGTKK